MNIVSLFSGCGGLDLGFEKAGFNIIWANEFDKTIHPTYRLNHPKTILNTSDVRTLTGEIIPDCDGIIGGPPCQAWSEGGKGLGIDDPRGQLFLDFIRIVKDKKPKFFVIENVQGILDKKHKKSLDAFLTILSDAGYNISYELLNAADYRIPQDRFRVFFVGLRNDLPNKFTFPNFVNSDPITLRLAIGDIIETPRFYTDELVEGDHPQRLNHDVYDGPYDSRYMARNRVRGWDENSFTLQAQARNAPQHPQAPKMAYVSASQRVFVKGYEHLYRRLSVRECARIQTFPDNFKFLYKDVKNGYKMVGNAVPPRLAWHLAMSIKKAFADIMTISANKECHNTLRIRQITVSNIAKHYPKHIVKNTNIEFAKKKSELNREKSVLISLIKPNNIKHYLNRTSKIYYTGKNFPSTIALNKLFYFMPYIKGMGIRDLYLIKIAQVGTKQEIYTECTDTDFRLIFEIQFIKQLFEKYIPFHLNIWHTFTDTTIESLLKINESYDAQ